MITENMKLETLRDAYIWASNLGDLDETQITELGSWIWIHKPFIGCTYAEHPVSTLDIDEFWNICDGEV